MIGKTISHYLIKSKIGEGGMGQVYLAEDTRLGRDVALKLVPDSIRGNVSTRERLLREATAASRLNHTNIVSLYDIGEADGRDYIVMEYVEGRPLTEIIEAGNVGTETALNLTRQICRALAAAHEKNVVHRDIKPDNILLTETGEIKVLDFGLAKIDGAGRMTEDGSTVGTLAYMAPEQIQGQDVDQRADLFSLGVLLYEMLTGRLPFRGEHRAAVTYAIVNEEPEPLARYKAGVPAELERITVKLLQKDRETRYQNAAGLMADLEAFQRSSGAASSSKKSGRPGSRIALFLIAVAVIIAGYFAVIDRSRDSGEIGIPKIAVIPFENMGPENESYFADGITEEITARLASIQGIRVIARTSVLQYRDTQKTIQQIGDELDVQYILEGTVRWQQTGDETQRVRVTPQLIRVADATHVWADVYDEPMTAVFEVQSDIATSVIQQLNVALLDRDRAIVEATPTENLKAYDYYLRGRDYFRTDWTLEDNLWLAVSMFAKAVELDDRFVEAYAYLSMSHGDLYWYKHDATESRLAAAKAAVDRALELNPGAFLSRLALGYYYYHGILDYDRALEQFETVKKLQPSNAYAFASIGYVNRRLGKWEECANNLKIAAELDPLASEVLLELGQTLVMMSRFEDAEPYLDRVINLAPGDPSAYSLKYISDLMTGDMDKARISAEAIPAAPEFREFAIGRVKLLERDFEGSLIHIGNLHGIPGVMTHQWYFPASMITAWVYDAMGEKEQANALFDSSRIHLEAKVQVFPDDARFHGSLGVAYAALGRRDDALREGRRAVELQPIARDAIRGAVRRSELAQIYMLIGDYDRAVDELEVLVDTPASFLSVPLLRLDPQWDRLRGHPRFKELIKK
jgi:serine/threonine protein kinase/tetratricopeptide (TPR) repeat protein